MDKKELINGLKEENNKWQTLLNQIGIARMDQSGVAGSWSIKDIIAHLTGWRRFTVARLRAVRNGKKDPSPPWPISLNSEYEINEWIYKNNHNRTVQDILDDSNQVFNEFIDAFEDLSEDILTNNSSFPWMNGQPLSADVFFSHFHEEHEPDIRAWLLRINKK